jgi:hypothetical protein
MPVCFPLAQPTVVSSEPSLPADLLLTLSLPCPFGGPHTHHPTLSYLSPIGRGRMIISFLCRATHLWLLPPRPSFFKTKHALWGIFLPKKWNFISIRGLLCFFLIQSIPTQMRGCFQVGIIFFLWPRNELTEDDNSSAWTHPSHMEAQARRCFSDRKF